MKIEDVALEGLALGIVYEYAIGYGCIKNHLDSSNCYCYRGSREIGNTIADLFWTDVAFSTLNYVRKAAVE